MNDFSFPLRCRVCGCSPGGTPPDDTIECVHAPFVEDDLCSQCARIELAIARLMRSESGRSAMAFVESLCEIGRGLNQHERIAVVALTRAAWQMPLYRDLIGRALSAPRCSHAGGD